MTFEVRPVVGDDRAWIREILRERWAGELMVIQGKVYEPAALPGFVAVDGDERIGLLTYALEGDACEIVSLDAVRENAGVGSALLDALVAGATAAGRERIRLVTTNDNERALAWYARRGFEVTELREGAVDGARRLKPSIPLTNEAGVPIRDEITLSRSL